MECILNENAIVEGSLPENDTSYKWVDQNENIKFSVPYHLLAEANETWYHQIWICHFFKHKKYNSFISQPNQQAN